MSSRGTRNSRAANDWAKKRALAIAKAKALRESRKVKLTDEHTFKPKKISREPSRELLQTGANDREPGVSTHNHYQNTPP